MEHQQEIRSQIQKHQGPEGLQRSGTSPLLEPLLKVCGGKSTFPGRWRHVRKYSERNRRWKLD